MYHYEPLKVITVFYLYETPLHCILVKHHKINKMGNEMPWLLKCLLGLYEGKRTVLKLSSNLSIHSMTMACTCINTDINIYH